MNVLIEKTAANKHSNIFLRIIHDICKIKIKISDIYISYQMHMGQSIQEWTK